MSTAQRSKTGCWTCRLRRKKCNEGGPPCTNCEARGVFCHGYGPKPPWKDRGEKEREQANRLQLQSRKIGRSRSKTLDGSISSQRSSGSSGASTGNPSTSITDVTTPDVFSPLQAEHSLSSTSPSQEHTAFDFFDSLELNGSWDASDLPSNFWPNSSAVQTLEEPNVFQPLARDLRPNSFDTSDTSFDPFSVSSNTDALIRLGDIRPPARALDSGAGIRFPNGATVAQGLGTEEREVELVMHFIGETFPLQHVSYRTASTKEQSWLLFLLTRSPTFFCASLSISAYHYHLTLPTDSEAREMALQDYQKYRALALSGFYEILEPSSVRPSSPLGEAMICGVQIALMEAVGKNMHDCQSHLTSAAQSLSRSTVSLFPNCVTSPKTRTSSFPSQLLTPTASPLISVSRSSPMERKAFTFFRVLLVWNDILSCSARKTTPVAVEGYRNLLADEQFTQDFRDIIGCESWILVAILDATLLEIWKRNLEAQGNLSIRELVSRAEKTESVLEQGIERISHIIQDPTTVTETYHVQTYIFAHSILTHLHTIVSGSWPNVPEIQQSVDRAIAAWKLRPPSLSLKALAWPYCASASLAVGLQRNMFRRLISEASSNPTGQPALESLTQLKAVVEECWRGFDERKTERDVSACDWKDVMQRMNLSILFAYF